MKPSLQRQARCTYARTYTVLGSIELTKPRYDCHIRPRLLHEAFMPRKILSGHYMALNLHFAVRRYQEVDGGNCGVMAGYGLASLHNASACLHAQTRLMCAIRLAMMFRHCAWFGMHLTFSFLLHDTLCLILIILTCSCAALPLLFQSTPQSSGATALSCQVCFRHQQSHHHSSLTNLTNDSPTTRTSCCSCQPRVSQCPPWRYTRSSRLFRRLHLSD
jgi:hypothetical protein